MQTEEEPQPQQYCRCNKHIFSFVAVILVICLIVYFVKNCTHTSPIGEFNKLLDTDTISFKSIIIDKTPM